ncbi:hypothetical protein [Actinoplanes sp. NPDC049802]|uniref:hypothetical protein n=1 Tax=Actinoplanes sp. NPDC049802 TaxID=3154742 RepID=UPI0033DCBDE3
MRRRPLVALTMALAVLSGCTGDPDTPAPSATAPAASPGISLDMPPASFGPSPPEPTPSGKLSISAAGYGPFRIGMTQQEITDAGLVTGLTPNGCGRAGGFTGAPETDVWGGELVRVRVTDPTVTTTGNVAIGATVDDVRAAYPSGRAVTGTGGVTGWLVVDGTGALLLELAGGTVSALTAGDATTVEKVFTGERGC